MSKRVFVSHSAKDKPVADAVCARLESKGIRCWIAPRDILPGSDWGEAIVDAISTSDVMVLVWTASANESPQIKREVERAVAKGIPIIPFRVEDVVPSKSFEYFLSTRHWLDALTPPLESHLESLAACVAVLLESSSGDEAMRPFPTAGRSPRRSAGSRQWLFMAGVLLALSGAGGFLYRNAGPSRQELARERSDTRGTGDGSAVSSQDEPAKDDRPAVQVSSGVSEPSESGQSGETESEALPADASPSEIRILEVSAEGKGASAGLRKGDVILAYAGRRFSDASSLVDVIRKSEGQEQAMILRRGTQELVVNVPAGPLDIQIQKETAPPPSSGEADQLSVVDWTRLTPAYMQTFDSEATLDEFWKGTSSQVWNSSVSMNVFQLMNSAAPSDVQYYHVGAIDVEMSEAPVSVEVRVTSTADASTCSNTNVGVLYRFNDRTKYYYAYTMAADGTLNFFKRNAQGYQQLYSGRSQDVRRTGFNRLGIIGKGGEFHLYVNEKLFKIVHDPELQWGVSGVIGIGTGHFEVDNFTICAAPRQP